MLQVTFSTLRNNAKKYFDSVEAGRTIEVYRKGRPIAMLVPVVKRSGLRWKKAKPLKVPGVSLSRAILTDREESV